MTTSVPENEVPLLGPGRELTQSGTQALLAFANALRQRRLELGRESWSAQGAATRAGRQYEHDLDPRIRAMSEADRASFERVVADDAANVAYTTNGRFRPTTGWMVRATIGPMPADSPSGGQGAWGVWASGEDTWSGRHLGREQEYSAFVVVRDEEMARQVQDEVVVGRWPMSYLQEVGTYGFLRAEHARTEVRETKHQLRKRVGEALRTAHPDEPDLIASMLTPIREENTSDYRFVDQLAGELQRLEERGHRIDDVLGRLDMNQLREEAARTQDLTTVVATRMVKDLAARQQIVDVEPIDPVAAREADQSLHLGLQSSGLDPELVYSSRGYDQLRAYLLDLQTSGRDVAALMEDLPADRIGSAVNAGAYLRRVIERRAEADPGTDPTAEPELARTRQDLEPAVAMVREQLTPDTAEAVLGCRTWPGLAKQLLAWKADGVSLDDEFAHLPERRINSAEMPAVYLKTLLRRGLDHRERVGTSVPSGQDHPTVRSEMAQPIAVEAETSEPLETVRDGIPPSPFPIRELDPTNVLDRAALEMSRGAGTLEDDEFIQRMLTTQDPAATWAELSKAEDAEKRAAVEARTSDDPQTPAREDVIGLDEAGADQSYADTARAAAEAEAAGSAAAPGLRAAAAHQPPRGATVAGPNASRPRPPATPTLPIRVPTPAPRRHR